MKTLVIIPAYNEEANIKQLLLLLKQISGVDLLVINDHSKDKTSLICHEEGANIIDLPCNLGIGGAVQTGYKYASIKGYDFAVQVDGDGQHNPQYIKSLIQPLIEKKADLVIGSRYINKEGFQSTFLRRVGINYFSKLLKILSKQEITDPTSGFRACNRNIINLFSSYYPMDYPEPESIVHAKRKGFVVKEIPVVMNERIGGVSSIRSFKSIYYMIKVSFAILFDLMRKQY